jgi:dinuclear metal center YbgI/SA1388 family protein
MRLTYASGTSLKIHAMELKQVVHTLETIAPLSLAESWDNVGLLVGDPGSKITSIITCLTVTQDVVEEAIKQQVQLIVSHHPVLFKPVQRMTTSTEETKLVWQLIRHGIAVYSPHTAYDNAIGGINEQLAHTLGLIDVHAISLAMMPAQCKIVVFVPESHLHEVSQAMFKAGAGILGNYEQCSFRSEGLGTFWGNSSSNPTFGKAGQFETAEEYRLEMVCPQAKLKAVLQALKSVHPYEEPAIDIVPLQSVSYQRIGTGRMGRLAVPLTPASLAERVSQLLQTPIILTGCTNRETISKVGIVCGAGGSLIPAAIKAGVHAFLTGEVRFHDELAAQAAGMTVLSAGHYATERPGVEQLAERLARLLPDCKVWASRAERNPAQWISSTTTETSG